MCSCKNSAKNLQKFCRFFCKIFATFLQLFCNFFATFLQFFCNFFAIFLQFFFKIFVNWFGIRTKGIHFRVTSRRGCWMIDSWPLVLFFFWKNFCTFFAKNLQKNCKKIAKKLQKSCKKIAKKSAKFLQIFCRIFATAHFAKSFAL